LTRGYAHHHAQAGLGAVRGGADGEGVAGAVCVVPMAGGAGATQDVVVVTAGVVGVVPMPPVTPVTVPVTG